MDKQTPTQIASEIMKGCGLKLNNGFEYSTCGGWSEIHKQPNYLCKSCRKSLLAYRNSWENELEFLEKIKMRIIEEGIEYHGEMCYSENLDKSLMEITNRVSELTSALKILNTKEAEK